jgi:tungstate transport system substrate-binding protein
MAKISTLLSLLLILCLAEPHISAKSDQFITLATTTSTENSGLLAHINKDFENKTGIKVKVIALGTGAAIKCAQQGDADLILVHARQREDQFIANGYGVKRWGVMHNDFVILGPKNDPAGLRGVKDALEAFRRIQKLGSIFVSRGDDSGTHIKEQSLWQKTGIPLEETARTITKKGQKKTVKSRQPKGEWYLSIGQGMGNTINFAYQKQGYTLADRGTYIAFKKKIDLVVLLAGDKRLYNPYGIIAVNPKKHPHVKFNMAMKYIHWILSRETQTKIANFQIDGHVLFIPDAFK